MQSIGERQRRVWLAAGVSAVAAAKLCGANWLWVLAGGLAACLYYLYIDMCLGTDGLADRLSQAFGFTGKVLCIFFVFWLILVMGWCARLADSAFPMVDGFPGLGLVLLGLTAWGCRKGPRACAGCSGILCLFLLVLYAIIAVFAAPNVEKSYLVPTADWKQGIGVLGLFLLPAGVWCVPVQEKKGKGVVLFFLLPVAAAVLAAITAGVLSPELAAARPVPVYDLAQSVSILGVVERIEPLLSAAMTMGIFCLLASLASACQVLSDQIGPWPWSGSLCCLGAVGTMYLMAEFPMGLLVGGNLVFFLLLPLAVSAFGKSQIFKKKGVDKDHGEC